jgi:hypothetical protein
MLQLLFPLTQKPKLHAFSGNGKYPRPDSADRPQLGYAAKQGQLYLFTEGRRHEVDGIAHEAQEGRHCPAAMRCFEEARRFYQMAMDYGDFDDATRTHLTQVNARMDPKLVVTNLPNGKVQLRAIQDGASINVPRDLMWNFVPDEKTEP